MLLGDWGAGGAGLVLPYLPVVLHMQTVNIILAMGYITIKSVLKKSHLKNPN